MNIQNQNSRPNFNPWTVLSVIAIAAVSLTAYHATLDNQFVWDTNHYLTTYEFWLSSLRFEHLIWMLQARELAIWIPATWFSWAVDYQIYGGLSPRGFHFTNNLLHAVNSILVFFLSRSLLVLAWRPANDRAVPNHAQIFMGSLFAALLFALHPQHVESVAWVAERKDVLFFMFTIASMLLYIRYARERETGSTGRLRTSIMFFALAIMSKPMAVTLPAVLLLLDVYPLRRTSILAPLSAGKLPVPLTALLREKVPFILLSSIAVLMTLLAAEDSTANFSLLSRAQNATSAVIIYLEKLFWPTDLSPFYPHTSFINAVPVWSDLLAFIALVLITAGVIWLWCQGHYPWLIAWLFFLITLSPVLGLVHVGSQGAADRFAYFPTVPAYVSAGALLAIAVSGSSRWRPVLSIACGITVLAILASLTVAQTRIWRDSASLWQHVGKLYPEDHVVNLQLGISALNLGENEKAAFHLDKSGAAQDFQTDLLAWRSLAYMRLGRYQEALDLHIELGIRSERVPQLRIDESCVQYNIGWNFAKLGHYQESADLFSRVDPESELAPEAGIWLEWIRDTLDSEVPFEIPDTEDLPGYCPKPLIRMNRWETPGR